MEVKIFDNFKDGVDFCVNNHPGERCSLLVYEKELRAEPEKNASVEFLAKDGVCEEMAESVGGALLDNNCILVPGNDKKNLSLVLAQLKIDEVRSSRIGDVSQLSDGYHTFSELYEFRKVYNAVLFNTWAIPMIDPNGHAQSLFGHIKYDVHKSWRHHDGELCFGGGWFIVVAVLPTGQISNHYEAKDWDLFKIPEVEKAKYEFDGHTSGDVIDRLLKL